MDGKMHRYKNSQTDEDMCGHNDIQTDGQMDRWTDGQLERLMSNGLTVQACRETER